MENCRERYRNQVFIYSAKGKSTFMLGDQETFAIATVSTKGRVQPTIKHLLRFFLREKLQDKLKQLIIRVLAIVRL